MKVYTKNQVEAIMLLGYRRGLEDGRMPKDRQVDLRPPTLEELGISHPATASDDPVNMAHKRPWLDAVRPAGTAVSVTAPPQPSGLPRPLGA